MAGSIKGITIQIGADTTKLSSALNSANRAIKSTQAQLNSVNKALKLDPANVSLLRDKQQLLNDKIADTKTKLDALKQAQAQLDGSGVDKNSKEYQELQTQIDLTTSELKTLTKESRNFGSVGAQAVAAVGEKLKTVGEAVTKVGTKFTTAFTLPIAAAGTVAVNSFAEVDKTMQLTNATMANTEEQAQLLNQAMKDAAAASTFNMTDAATATLNFARAGLTAEEAAEALAPAMSLAAGEGGNLDTVSGGLVATINGFGGSFSEASAYADVFANACNRSALDIDSLSEAMSVAAPIFSAAGYSVNDAALYMGVMADAGIDASTAANALKTGLARLVSPTEEAQQVLDQLGICITNADGSMKDSVTVQQELHDAFAGLSESEQLAAASSIFGKNQMSNWLALINTSPDSVNSLSNALTEEGTTASMAEAMMSGFGGSIEQLKSSIDVAATSFGEALAPTIQKVSDAIQKAVDWFNSLSAEQQQTIAKVALVVAAIGPLILIIGKVITVVGTLMSIVPVLGAAIPVLCSPITLVIAAIAAVIAIGVLLYKNWDKIKEKAAEIGSAIKEKWNSAKSAVKEAVSNMKDAVSEKFSAMKDAVANSAIGQTVGNVWNAAKETMSNSLSAMKEAYDSHGGGLKGAVAATMEGVKQKYTAAYNFVDNLTDGKFSGMLSTVKGKMSDVATNVSSKLTSVKDYFSEKLQTAANTASTNFGLVKSYVSTKMSDVATNVSSKLTSVKDYFETHLGTAASTTSTKMQSIKNSFINKLTEAKDKVSEIIQKIKDLFNVDLKLNIKLPHISVNGGVAPFGIGGQGTLPSFNVQWYDKGGIFDKPSIIGVGEKRPEFVGALDDLRQIVREESGVSSEVLLASMQQMVSLMSELVAQNGLARPIQVNQTINANETSYYEQQKQAARQFKEIARLV